MALGFLRAARAEYEARLAEQQQQQQQQQQQRVEPAETADAEPTLKSVWVASGRPGAARLYDAARRAGLQVNRKDVADFLRRQETRQVFASGPASDGRVTAARLDATWQVDLIDFKQMNPAKNNGFTVVLVIVDVFSRFMWATALQDKTQQSVLAAFRDVLRNSGRRCAEVDSDGGPEFRGVFAAFLANEGIAHRLKNSKQLNALAVVDSAIGAIKRTIAQEMVDKGDGNWVQHLPPAVRAHNASSHSHLMGSEPKEVEDNEELRYELQKQAGLDLRHNGEVHKKRVEKLRETGAFRVMAPRSTWMRAMTPQWGDRVHTLREVVGGVAVDSEGNRYPVRDTLPVPADSADTRAPDDLRGRARDAERREALERFASSLERILGRKSLAISSVGLRLRTLRGFNAALREQGIPGRGALERFIRLYPDRFTITGAGQSKRVERKRGASTG